MNKNTIVVLAACTMLAACGTGGRKTLDAAHVTPQTKYVVKDAKVTLTSLCEGKSYPDEKQLSKIFTDKIKENFCKDKKCETKAAEGADVIEIDTTIAFKRTFMGEAFHCNESYGLSTVDYSYELSKGGKPVFTSEPSGEIFINKGFFGNAGRIATQLSATGTPEDELKDINSFAAGISRDIAAILPDKK